MKSGAVSRGSEFHDPEPVGPVPMHGVPMHRIGEGDRILQTSHFGIPGRASEGMPDLEECHSSL